MVCHAMIIAITVVFSRAGTWQLAPLVNLIAKLVNDGCRVRIANILISGGTGAGKTTLLNVLSGYIPNTDRVVRISDRLFEFVNRKILAARWRAPSRPYCGGIW
jgi:ABC-type taurine transport system ATPase subunit